MKPDLLTFVLCAFAAHRLTRLIVKDDLTMLLRDWLKNHAFKTMVRRDDFGTVRESREEARGSNNLFVWLWTLFTCQWCLGVWVSTLVVLAAVNTSGAITTVVWIAACSGGVGLLGELT